MPGDTQYGVTEPSFKIRKTHWIKIIVHDVFAEILQDHVNILITWGIAKDGFWILVLESDKSSMTEGKKTDKEKSTNHLV